MKNFLQDLRYATRMLRKNPGFTAIVVVALALGIASSTAIFSIVDQVLLRPLPYPHPEQILDVSQSVRSTGARKFAMLLLAIFAGLAVLLAATGLYGVMSYSVAQRTRAIGIRVALGAQRGDVFRLVINQGMLFVAIGVAAGLVGSLGLTRLISTLLFGVSSTDAATFGGVALLLALIALLACWLPARRATHVDPVIALRTE